MIKKSRVKMMNLKIIMKKIIQKRRKTVKVNK
jgi:hypothetical protein